MNRLKELREDMSQEEVGKILGVSKMTISRYERDGATIPLDSLRRFCELYNVTSDYALGFSPVPFPAVSEAEAAILAAYHAASDDLRAVVNFALSIGGRKK